jgi:DNA-binding NtrC family response regulator
MAHKSQFRSLSVSVQSAGVSSPAPEFNSPGEHIIPLPEVERRAILEALRYTKGDRATAAMMLGIGRTTLYRKLKEYQLDE